MSEQVAELAEAIRPHLERIVGDGLPLDQAVEAAVLLWHEAEREAFARRFGHLYIITELLSATWDEFRAEAGVS